MWQGLEGQPFDVVLRGAEVGHVAALRVGAVGCAEAVSRAQAGARHFECAAPPNAGADSAYFHVTVSYDTGALETRAGPFYTLSRSAWEGANGQFYFQSLAAYVLWQAASAGPQITLKAIALSGLPGDLPSPGYFNAVRLHGASGSVTCPYAGSGWRYQCPPIPGGRYAVDVLREQGALYVVGNQFLVQVSEAGASVPAPAPAPSPTPTPTPTPTPGCNPATDKGC